MEYETQTAENTDVFSSSLLQLESEDIELNETAKNVKKPPVDFIRYFMFVISLGIFIYAGYNLAERLYFYTQSASEYNDLRDMFYEDENKEENHLQMQIQTTPVSPLDDVFTLQILGVPIIENEIKTGIKNAGNLQHKITKLSDINPDYFGWLTVSETSIDYPVVQGSDNDYYLKHTFEGNRNDGGAIFVDHENSREILENRNLVIYGHNMLDNSMFQPLVSTFGRANSRAAFDRGAIKLLTAEATYYYTVFSVREEQESSGYIRRYFYSDEQWIEFLLLMQSNSKFQKQGIEFDADSKIITLSTCVGDSTRRDWRFTVQGILVNVVPNETDENIVE